jgi:hypothetical protein
MWRVEWNDGWWWAVRDFGTELSVIRKRFATREKAETFCAWQNARPYILDDFRK